MTTELIQHFREQWKFLRNLTYDFVESIPASGLEESPGENLSPWWKQFRHLGRVQENYLAALDTGIIQFTTESSSYHGGADKAGIVEYLHKLDVRLLELLELQNPSKTIDWSGTPFTLGKHLLCLADHEILHHGQWVVYRQVLGGKFPPSWSVWGL